MLTVSAWLLLAALHLLPALAFVRPELLVRLYGAQPGSDTFLLLQHRAALFVVVMIACLWAAADPEVRRLASVLAATSMVSFLILWFAAGSPAALRSIAIADLAGLPLLAFVAFKAFARG